MKQFQYIIVWETMIICFFIQSIYGFLEPSNPSDRTSIMTTNQAMLNGNENLRNKRFYTHEFRDYSKNELDQRNPRKIVTNYELRVNLDNQEANTNNRSNRRILKVETRRNTRQFDSMSFHLNRESQDRFRSRDDSRLGRTRGENSRRNSLLRDTRDNVRQYREVRDNRVHDRDARERYTSQRENQERISVDRTRHENPEFRQHIRLSERVDLSRSSSYTPTDNSRRSLMNRNTRDNSISREIRTTENRIISEAVEHRSSSERQMIPKNPDYTAPRNIRDFRDRAHTSERFDLSRSRRTIPVENNRRSWTTRNIRDNIVSRETLELEDRTAPEVSSRRDRTSSHRMGLNIRDNTVSRNIRDTRDQRHGKIDREFKMYDSRLSAFRSILNNRETAITRESDESDVSSRRDRSSSRHTGSNIRNHIASRNIRDVRDRRDSDRTLKLGNSDRQFQLENSRRFAVRNIRDSGENTRTLEVSERRMFNFDENNRYLTHRENQNRLRLTPEARSFVQQLGTRQNTVSSSRNINRTMRNKPQENTTQRIVNRKNLSQMNIIPRTSLKVNEVSTEADRLTINNRERRTNHESNNIRSRELDRRTTINTRNIRLNEKQLENGSRVRFISSSGRINEPDLSSERTRNSRYNLEQDDHIVATESKKSSFFQSYDLVLFAIFAMQMVTSSSFSKGLRSWGFTSLPKQKVV